MILRKLKIEDAPLMLEWMHDKNVTDKLQTNFADKDIKNCEKFIEKSLLDNVNKHYAVEENGIYMGTVSLKHVNAEFKSAEFAIAIRSCAMGKGISKSAMLEMLDKAFCEYGLKYVYWCVAEDNLRALRFYDKNGFGRINVDELDFIGSEYTDEQKIRYIWYCVRR